MQKHHALMAATVAAVALLAGCASPSKPTATAAAPAPAPAPAVAAPAPAPVAPAGGSAGAAGTGDARSASLPSGSAAAPAAPAAPSAPAPGSVYFAFDSSTLNSSDLALVEAVGRYLNAASAATARVEGHADERGSREYNLALGQRRAQAVVESLRVLGVNPSRVEAVSYGEERPRAQGSNEEAWAQNRRADVTVRAVR